MGKVFKGWNYCILSMVKGLEFVLRQFNPIDDYRDWSHRKPSIHDPTPRHFGDVIHNFAHIALIIKPIMRGMLYGGLVGYGISQVSGEDYTGFGMLLGMKADMIQYSVRMGLDLMKTFSEKKKTD